MNVDLKAAVEWLRRFVEVKRKGLALEMRLPPEMAETLIAHIDSEPQRIAAKAEEVREACVKAVEALIERRWPDAGDRPSSPPAAVLDALTRVAATPLDATPLADENRALRERAQKAEAERDEALRALRGLRREVSAKLTGRDSEPGEFEKAWQQACAVLAKYPEGT